MGINLEALASGDLCEFAKARYAGIARWRFLYTLMVFVLSALVATLLALAIVFVFNKEWAQGIVTGLGGIVSGTAMKFILERRNEAKEEEEAAYADVIARCGGPSGADELRSRYTIFGLR